jgi:predicted hydrolase (HD superfamily)
MRQVTSSSISASLKETNTSIVDEASDLALHLGWYLTAFHQWKRLNTVDTSMGEDRAVELEVVEREPKSVVLARHWIGDEAVMHR